ncbi:MAG TPA: flagellar biosynthesis anti-sigma factor FlgM [Polyangiaceae bacterium]|jgi:flagellar biosynthesis anti-sigma factor FlgM|nr:flagellar biosynthesis anti-sigma factor FlgM [Polyangiaceae bacterium]
MKSVGSNSTVVGAYQRMAISEVGGAKPQARVEPGAQEPAPRAAQVSISNQARELSQSAEGDIDVKKVNALKSAIQAGTFHVDAHAIATRLLDQSA